MGDVFVSGTLKGAVGKAMSSMGTNADGTSAACRTGKYGEQMVLAMGAKGFALAEEGSLFVATNPTISTGVKLQGDTTTAWVATTPSFLIYNANSTGGKNIILDKIRLINTVAGAGSVALHAAALIDTGNRYASGGTAITTAKCTNMDVTTASGATLYYGATASAASTSVRTIGRAVLRGAISVVADQYTLDFGGPASSNGTDGTTTIMDKSFPMPATVIGPGQSFLLYLWAASMSTHPSFEFEISWIER